MDDNRTVTLSLTVKDARRIADALFQNISSAIIINTINKDDTEHGLRETWHGNSGESFSEVTKTARTTNALFIERYFDAVSKLIDITPFDDEFTRPLSLSEYSLVEE